MKHRTVIHSTALSFLVSAFAQAALIVSVPVQPVVLLPGGAAQIQALISNPDEQAISINSLSLNWTAPQLDVSPFPFLLWFPLVIEPNQELETVVLIISASIDASPVDATVTLGLQGGPDEFAFDELSSIDIAVRVPGGGIVAEPVPEPATVSMMGFASVLFVVRLVLRRRRGLKLDATERGNTAS